MKPVISIFEVIHNIGIDYLTEFADIKFAYGADRKQCLALTSESDAIVIKSVVQVDKELLRNSSRLRVIGRAGTGIDNIDIIEAKKRNVKVLTVPRGNSVSAAEFTVLQMLSFCRRMHEVTNYVNNNDFRRHLMQGVELQNMTVGLVGLGNVGMLVFERLKAFGCNVLGYDPSPKDRKGFISNGGIYIESFEQLLPEVDFLSFHARLTPENYQMMGEKQFQIVKDGLFLINCARADLVDQAALLKFVNNGKIAMAALDVLEPEPPFDLHPKKHNYQHKLLKHPNIIVTPHIGGSTIEAQKRISISLCKQIRKELLNQ